MNVKFALKEATRWSEAGRVMAQEQFSVTPQLPLSEIDTDSEPSTLSVKEENGELVISGDKFSASFNKTTSVLT
ncbi:MAG: hypothetical protein IKY54_06995, partial [Muribaculaceae bacterium]|nr:hypothetical protein [Muribaculaceae bacterium]